MADEYTFAGAVISVLARAPANGAVLENACVRSLNDRSFIVGRLADQGTDNSDPRVGLTFWFALDDVVMITEFPDLRAAQAALAARESNRQGSCG